LLSAAATRIGKYGTGTNTIILPMKLAVKTPRYPKLSNNVKSQSSVDKRNTSGHVPIYLVVVGPILPLPLVTKWGLTDGVSVWLAA
jgi:hypothetical protein